MSATTQPTGTDSPPAPVAVVHNYALSDALARFAAPSNHPVTNAPQKIAIHGMSVIDQDHTDPKYRQRPLIWFGLDYCGEGRWLTAEEVIELAEALRLVALGQRARTA